jgi:hypothetical protein
MSALFRQTGKLLSKTLSVSRALTRIESVLRDSQSVLNTLMRLSEVVRPKTLFGEERLDTVGYVADASRGAFTRGPEMFIDSLAG